MIDGAIDNWSLTLNTQAIGTEYLEGRVLDYVTGEPISGAEVTLNDQSELFSGFNGEFLFGNLETGKVHLTVRNPGYYDSIEEVIIAHDSNNYINILMIPSVYIVTPSFSPEGGSFVDSIDVIITCVTPDVEIHYTTNGNDPMESDPIVVPGGTVRVDHSLILKARAWATGYEPSSIAQGIYSIDKADQQTIIFGKKNGEDLVWLVRKAYDEGPGPNNWCSKKVCVELLEDGLHLRIRQIEGQWYCSEVFTNESLGYGIYKFVVATNSPYLDPQTVVGLFTYDKNQDGNKNEIDIELTRWGNPQNEYNAQHAVYIPNLDTDRTKPEVFNKKQMGESFTL
ncbi:MAG: carboxypeptidase regulatory-like domain-containing protein [Sedimentisphaerales bacterium]|nr:carboxypeptidase regulatory-like domain-containing protein [Sedimentisphaerales bacterium]